MASIHDMTVDELAQVITPQFLEESAQQIAPILQQIPFQVFQDQTAKYVTVLPGVRNQITFGELDGDAQLAPYSVQNHDKAEYGIVGRTLVVYPGNCAKDFDPMPLLHSIWGESIALGENISKHNIARKLVSLFAGKIGMHINDVIFCGAVRNVRGTTTADLFDSFDTIIGAEITAEKVFRPADTSGYVELPFAFDCTSLAGKTVVAFEYLYRGNVLIASHTDINDEAQTVTIDRKPTPTPTRRPTSTPVPSKKVSGTPSSSRTPSSSGTAVRTAGPVKTGDTTNIILPVVLLGASAAAIGFALVKRKKI